MECVWRTTRSVLLILLVEMDVDYVVIINAIRARSLVLQSVIKIPGESSEKRERSCVEEEVWLILIRSAPTM